LTALAEGAHIDRLEQALRLPPPKPARVRKREAKRQQTLTQRNPPPQAAASPAPAGWPQTWLGRERGLLSWSQCPVLLNAVVNRECNERGEIHD
jgi:hypothetical protein